MLYGKDKNLNTFVQNCNIYVKLLNISVHKPVNLTDTRRKNLFEKIRQIFLGRSMLYYTYCTLYSVHAHFFKFYVRVVI